LYRFYAGYLISLLFAAGSSFAVNSEIRYFWLVRDGLSTPEQVDSLLERASLSGANGVIVQVVGRGEAYYRSDVLPQANYSGFDDPLEYVIQKAGPLGLEVHAWVNAFLVWSGPSAPESPYHVLNAHPEWFIAHRSGRSSMSYSATEAEASGIVGATLSPAFPGVRGYVADIAREIALNYDVTGIHLDYIRYPNSAFGYSSGELEVYYLDTGLRPEDDSASWSRWRTEQVTATVTAVRAVLRSAAPELVLSCAVMADPGTALSEFSCDWRYWLETGLVDMVCPMAYTSDPARALELAAACTAENPSAVVYGIGVWNQTVDNALTGARAALQNGAGGICVFSLNSLPEGAEETLRSFWGYGSSPDHGVSPAMFNRVAVP